MINLNFPIQPDLTYPYSGYPTSNAFLQSSLGSFWNSIFTEQGTLRGLTIGQSEELIQAYQNLTEVIQSFSIKNINPLHKEIWQPLVIQKSLLDFSPFVFEQNNAVFGPQPSTDELYANQVFQFGFPKTTTQYIYSWTPPFTIREFPLITNSVYTPDVYYINGVDVILNDGNLFFNIDPFENPNNTIINIIGNNGVPTTYVDRNGITQQDQLLILWMYYVQIDQKDLYNNFGYIFGVNQPSSQEYKNILSSFFNIAVEGATVKAMKSLLAYIGGIVPIICPQETVQYVATNEYNQVVVTDKNSYLFNLTDTLLPSVQPGVVFYAGDILTNLFTYYDAVVQKDWWEDIFQNNSSIALSSNIFLGNYQHQLVFDNTIQLITLSPSGVLNFPVSGSVSDVAIFQNYINESVNKAAIIESLGLVQSTNPSKNRTSYPINPINFLFENFFKNNTSLLLLNFSSPEATANFFTLFKEVMQYLPKHVYLMMLVNMSVLSDIYDNLNGKYTIAAYPGQLFNADGSNAEGTITLEAPYYYKNLPIRLFSLGITPLGPGGEPLIATANLPVVGSNGISTTGGINCIDGAMFTYIPSGATTITTPQIRLIDFN